jgi:hypothetical protein
MLGLDLPESLSLFLGLLQSLELLFALSRE